MYGAAGWTHTPGVPGIGAKLKQKANIGIPAKGAAGQRPTRNQDSKYRHKEAKNAKV
jgi:hypothetical protein